MASIRVGTIDFCQPPAAYGDAFGVVEIGQPVYRSPRLEVARSWRSEAPAGFEFTLEAHRLITHPDRPPRHRGSPVGRGHRRADAGAFRDDPAVHRAWRTTMDVAETLGARLVVFATPAGFRPTDANVARLVRFFEWAHRGGLGMGWQPAGREWTDGLVRRLCRELSLAHVVDPLARASVRPRPQYYRLRGGGDHHHRYTDTELARLEALCAGPQAYCLFGNDGRAEDALRFVRRLAGDQVLSDG